MAIAGLILVIVFLAVSGAQSARRDATRKHDLARMAAQLEVFASDNHGSYPTVDSNVATGFTGGFASTYLPNNFNDPSGAGPYNLNLHFGPGCMNGSAPLSPHGPGAISYEVPGANGNPYKIRICLETGEYDIGT
jgi:hypothetical protein